MNERDPFRDPADHGPTLHPADERPTTAGMTGFITALVALGLLAVVFVLYLMLREEELLQENIERRRWMYYWFLILDIASFFAGLIASILGGRALSPFNPLYRRFGMFALLGGIFVMIVTVGFGLFMMCAVAWLEINRNAGRG